MLSLLKVKFAKELKNQGYEFTKTTNSLIIDALIFTFSEDGSLSWNDKSKAVKLTLEETNEITIDELMSIVRYSDGGAVVDATTAKQTLLMKERLANYGIDMDESVFANETDLVSEIDSILNYLNLN